MIYVDIFGSPLWGYRVSALRFRRDDFGRSDPLSAVLLADAPGHPHRLGGSAHVPEVFGQLVLREVVVLVFPVGLDHEDVLAFLTSLFLQSALCADDLALEGHLGFTVVVGRCDRDGNHSQENQDC